MLFDSRKLLLITALLGVSFACAKKEEKEEEKNVPVMVNTLNMGTKMELRKSALGLMGLGGPETPDYAAGEYDGMGVFTSDAVVEAFKIKITSVSFGSKQNQTAELLVPEADQEMDISRGVNKALTISGSIPKGQWDRVTVTTKPEYKLKAYAYMDTNNDGTIDTTVFTTASEIKKSAGRLTAAELTAAGYDIYEYKFMYVYCSETPTGSTTSACSTLVVLPDPINTEEPPKDEAGNVRADNTYTVALLIDSTKVVAAWTGESGTYQMNGETPTKDVLGDSTYSPFASAGFPLSATCSDTKNPNGFNTCDFFPYGKPAFKMNYLPAFAFLGADTLSSQVYAISTEEGSWNHYNSGFMEVVLSNGKPIFGKFFTTTDWKLDQTVTPWKVLKSQGPIVGAVARLFEQVGDTYTFYGDYGSYNADGVDDGGLMYNNDKSMAGYIFEGFKLLSMDGTSTITAKDGPRCKSEYDTCVGDRTYYVKRIK